MVQLISPRLRISIERPLDDAFDQYDVQTDNRDLIAWDATRPRRQWPAGTDAPVLWMTYLAWHALKRTGAPVPESFDDFTEICVDVRPIDRDGSLIEPGSGETVTDSPIPPVPVTG